MSHQILGPRVMLGLGEQVITIIQQRTQSSRDMNGIAFKPYTKKYEKRRVASGRSTIPNLTWSGRMLGNMVSKFVETGKAIVLFSKSQEALKAKGNNNKREFFGIESNREIGSLKTVRILGV